MKDVFAWNRFGGYLKESTTTRTMSMTLIRYTSTWRAETRRIARSCRRENDTKESSLRRTMAVHGRCTCRQKGRNGPRASERRTGSESSPGRLAESGQRRVVLSSGCGVATFNGIHHRLTFFLCTSTERKRRGAGQEWA